MSEKEAEKLEIPIDDLKATSLETAKFAFHQAEECLKSSIAVDDSIDQKTFRIITWVFPVLTGIIIWMFSEKCISIPILFGIYSMIILLIVSLILCLFIIFPKLIHILGNEPRNIFSCIPYLVKDEKQTAITIIKECKNYQKYITTNYSRIEKKAFLIKAAIFLMCLSPVAGIILFSILSLLFS